MSVFIGLGLLNLLVSESIFLPVAPAQAAEYIEFTGIEFTKESNDRHVTSGESVEALTQHASDTPNDPRGLSRLAASLFDQGRFEEAEHLYRDVIRLTPEDPLAYYDLGLTLLAQDRYDEAIETMQAVIRLAPDDSFAHFELGQMQHFQGQFAAAEAAFRIVIRLDPDDALAYDRLSQTLASQGRTDESAIAAATASELDRANIFCLRDPSSCDNASNPFLRPKRQH